jgi:hypothetical protein
MMKAVFLPQLERAVKFLYLFWLSITPVQEIETAETYAPI